MAGNNLFNSGVIQLTTTTTTNLLNPGAVSGGVNMGTPNTWLRITKITIGNATTGATSAALWLGATGVNTAATALPEVPGIASAGTLTNGVSIPANSCLEKYTDIKLNATQFIVGGALATGLTIIFEGEQGIVP